MLNHENTTHHRPLNDIILLAVDYFPVFGKAKSDMLGQLCSAFPNDSLYSCSYLSTNYVLYAMEDYWKEIVVVSKNKLPNVQCCSCTQTPLQWLSKILVLEYVSKVSF